MDGYLLPRFDGECRLSAGELFPLEIRALAIAFFFAVGTGIGGVISPWLFAALIKQGSGSLYSGYLVLSATMIAAALVELLWGVSAERKPLEVVARPLTFVDDKQTENLPRTSR